MLLPGPHQLPLDGPWVESPPRFPLHPSVKVPLGMALDLPSILFMAGRPQEANPKQAGSAGSAPVLTPLPQKRGPARVLTQDSKRAAADTGSGGTMGRSPLLGVSSLLLRLMLAAWITGSSVAVSRRFHVARARPPTPRPTLLPGWKPQENRPCSGVVLRSGRYMSPKAPA